MKGARSRSRSKRVPFVKMSGAGNDFILIDRAQLRAPTAFPALARKLCPRRTSIGADGLLIVSKARIPEMQYYNADGSRAFCGNGSRCAAWWMYRAGWGGKKFSFRTPAGRLSARVTGPGMVRLAMPEARIVRRDLCLRAGGGTYRAMEIFTGAPHAVVRVNLRRLGSVPVEELGRALRSHRAFRPHGMNVDFVGLDRRGCRLRTYERGVEGETLACGTGAVAAAVFFAAWKGGARTKKTAAEITVPVFTRSGAELTVRFRSLGEDRFSKVSLEGPADSIFEGEVML